MLMQIDHCVVGGGIVGTATAMSLLERRPGAGPVLSRRTRDSLGTRPATTAE
jgi:glycine/D-amino acid oxidase-like deaminating enzyme